MVTIASETAADVGAREDLLNRVMPERFEKPSQLLRSGRLPARGLALVARQGRAVVGTVRLWSVVAGGCSALLLGPLCVDPLAQGKGIGSALMHTALARAAKADHPAVILVGDPAFYTRFGFSAALTRNLVMPKAVEARRFLGLELTRGALDGATGPVVASGRLVPTPVGEGLRLAA